MKWMHDAALVLHVCAGFAALVLFWAAALAPKGGRAHRRAGRVYVFVMMAVVATALVMAALLALAPQAMRDFTGIPASAVAATSLRLRGVAGFFVALALLTVTAGWNGIVAVRSRGNPTRGSTRVSAGLAVLNVAVAGPMIWLGLLTSEPLLVIFAVVCLLTGGGEIRRRWKSQPPRASWVHAHLTNMIATGIAAHTAFFAVGAVRLFPQLYSYSPALYVVPWILPAVIGSFTILLAKRSLRRSVKGAAVIPAELPTPRAMCETSGILESSPTTVRQDA